MRVMSMLLVSVMFGCGAAIGTTEPPFDLDLGQDPEAVPQTKSERVGRTVLMGNSFASDARDFRQSPGAVRWSPWEGYCCESGATTRSCLTVDADALPSCRDAGKLAIVCKELEGCSGPECFCCSHGLETACSVDRVRAQPQPEESRVPHRPAPSIWSPHSPD